MLKFNISGCIFAYFCPTSTRCFIGTKYLPKFTQSPIKALPKPSPVGFNRWRIKVLQGRNSGHSGCSLWRWYFYTIDNQ